MAEQKIDQTSKGMPLVTEQTIKIIFDSDEKGSEKWGAKRERVKERMIKEQPHLVKFIEGQTGKYPREMHDALFETGVAIYAVLEQQSGADKLSSSFGVGGEEKG